MHTFHSLAHSLSLHLTVFSQMRAIHAWSLYVFSCFFPALSAVCKCASSPSSAYNKMYIYRYAIISRCLFSVRSLLMCHIRNKWWHMRNDDNQKCTQVHALRVSTVFRVHLEFSYIWFCAFFFLSFRVRSHSLWPRYSTWIHFAVNFGTARGIACTEIIIITIITISNLFSFRFVPCYRINQDDWMDWAELPFL